jgi:hypothetical protein
LSGVQGREVVVAVLRWKLEDIWSVVNFKTGIFILWDYTDVWVN